jgi:transposase
MSSSVSYPPSRLINDELWVLVEPLIPPREPALRYDRSTTTITALARLAVTLICARRLLAN